MSKPSEYELKIKELTEELESVARKLSETQGIYEKIFNDTKKLRDEQLSLTEQNKSLKEQNIELSNQITRVKRENRLEEAEIWKRIEDTREVLKASQIETEAVENLTESLNLLEEKYFYLNQSKSNLEIEIKTLKNNKVNLQSRIDEMEKDMKDRSNKIEEVKKELKEEAKYLMNTKLALDDKEYSLQKWSEQLNKFAIKLQNAQKR